MTNQTLGHFPAANHAPESPSLTENLQRLLQSSSSSSSDNNNNNNGGSSGTTNEGSLLFFGMILFLFFIAFACFPFCYRKRRNNTGGLARPGTARSAASGPTTSRQTPRQPASAPPVPVKKVDFVKRLDKTTMQVSPKDLLRRDESQRITGGIISVPAAASEGGDDDGQKENGGSVLFDIELGNDMSAALSEAFADNTVLRLPKGKPNGDRLVPSTCAICLSNYRPGENVSWSSNPRCQHAFHTSCMVKYAEAATLKKRKEGKDAPVACPLCRNSFISEQGKEHDHKI